MGLDIDCSRCDRFSAFGIFILATALRASAIEARTCTGSSLAYSSRSLIADHSQLGLFSSPSNIYRQVLYRSDRRYWVLPRAKGWMMTSLKLAEPIIIAFLHWADRLNDMKIPVVIGQAVLFWILIVAEEDAICS